MSSELTEEYTTDEWWVEEGYASPDDVPVPDWHLAMLEERMARYESEDKTKWRTWDEVERELLEKLSKSLTTKALTD